MTDVPPIATGGYHDDDKPLVDRRAGNNHFVSRKVKSGDDNYETPAWAVEALVKREPGLRSFLGGHNWSTFSYEPRGCRKLRILDPCCGPGAIVRELRRMLPDASIVGHESRTNIVTMPAGCVGGVDFLTTNRWDGASRRPDWCVMNPPFTCAMEFAERCQSVATRAWAVFQRTNWIEGCERHERLWSRLPIRTIYPFVHRVNCYPEGQVRPLSGMLCFAWYVFEHGFDGAPTVEWIDDRATLEHDTRLGMTDEMRIAGSRRRKKGKR